MIASNVYTGLTLRNLEGYDLVELHRSPDTRAVRPEALTVGCRLKLTPPRVRTND